VVVVDVLCVGVVFEYFYFVGVVGFDLDCCVGVVDVL